MWWKASLNSRPVCVSQHENIYKIFAVFKVKVSVIHRNWPPSNSANAGSENQWCLVTCTLYIYHVQWPKPERKRGGVKYCVAKWSWVDMGCEIWAGQPHSSSMISPCPQCFLGKWSAVNWFCVSLYICLHINRHLPKSLQESPPWLVRNCS